jgi:hypothetical protein
VNGAVDDGRLSLVEQRDHLFRFARIARLSASPLARVQKPHTSSALLSGLGDGGLFRSQKPLGWNRVPSAGN